MASRSGARVGRARAAPIDPQAVATAEARLLRERLGRSGHETVLRAACNLTRMQIVRALAATPLAASDLARIIARTPAATSQHIRVLRDVEAIEAARTGNVVRYRLTRSATARILQSFAQSLDEM
jgi:DNA-binding transcriptional ArsR family regulator